MAVPAVVGLSAAHPAPERIELRASTAIAFADDGKPRFRADLVTLLKAAESLTGEVVEYDADKQMVRISTSDADALWLRCSDLKPMTESCSSDDVAPSRPLRRTRGGSPNPDTVLGIIPNCPGDPRCPRLK